MFEQKLKEFLYGKDDPERAEREHREREIAREVSAKDHSEKVARAMEAQFESKLYRLIAQKLQATLQEEGPLEYAQLKAKCPSVTGLQDALLYRHIQYAIDAGMIAEGERDGMTLYTAC